MNEDAIQELKIKINQFFWEHAPGAMTLEQAEKAARAVLRMMVPDVEPNQD